MKKRTLSFILALAMLAALPVMAGASSWADDMMKDLLGKGILAAIPEAPDEFIKREEFSVMLAKAMLYRTGDSLKAGVATVFADNDEIFSGNVAYILYLYEQGILRGSMIDGKLYMLPNSLITRQEAMALLGRWLGLNPDLPVSQEKLFTDDDTIQDYARSIIYQLVGMSVVTGYPDGSYMPVRNISHAETSSLIFKVLNGKILQSYFGNGDLGNADGGPRASMFSMPYGLCLDNSGNLVVFDTFNASIKRISGGLSVTMLGFTDALDDYEFTMPYYLDGKQEEAMFGRPVDGVYNADGDFFIVDRENHAIRVLLGDTVYTYAGGVQGFGNGRNEDAMFDSPSAIAIDKSGVLYVADTMNHCIRKIDTDRTVSTIAGRAGTPGYANANGSAALFCEPSGIAVDSEGAIYVADTGNHVIRKISGGFVTTVAGTVSSVESGEDYAPGGSFNFPRGLCWADGKLYIADTGDHTVKMLTGDGNVSTVAGSGEPGDRDGTPDTAMLNNPASVVYSNGVLYIADTFNNKIKSVWLDK